MMSRRSLLAAGLAAALVLPGLPAAAQDHPETFHVHDAYARVTGGIGGSGAVFLMLHNNGQSDDRLIGAKSDVAEMAGLHTHRIDDAGVAQMVEIEGGIVLEAGDAHSFERGGDHIMLMGLTRELKDGDSVPVTLIFESGAEVALDAIVDNKRMPGAPGETMMEDDAMTGDHGHGESGG